MANRNLDDLDRALLALLETNAREPTASLARKLGVSRTTVQDRIQRLERDGVVGGYTVRPGSGRFETRITAYVMIAANPKLNARVVHALKAMPEVKRLHAVSGAHDLLAMISAEDTRRIDEVLDAIGGIPGIERTMSSIVLSTKLER
ncbi:Lrp/AsnC family transcriptional regulator [Arenibaculum sp.]|jgi:DNA-binding Lrp family transcriptional regulator|uniref:Lrp/AsnC family transcriptional regulator n=1 Tax=Arenibaculum sp. TaxID=2865862 RepID=UPI002E0F4E3D|nr:Lrp/AsnC family transcriptional regulator [Arenibaculum sp.]